MLTKAYIPYRGYYSSPFARWQGAFANKNAIILSAKTSGSWFKQKQLYPIIIEYLFYGSSIYQPRGFYSAPWAATLMGAEHITGTIINQACSTSAITIWQAAMGVETGMYETSYCLISDRMSNSPHTIWPTPDGRGNNIVVEDQVMDNFNSDPCVIPGQPMIQTAENVSTLGKMTREQLDEITLRRYEQYGDALANDCAFHKRYIFPTLSVKADTGIKKITKERLKRLKPVLQGGIHTIGSQTYPADGHCAMFVTTKNKAEELSEDKNITIQIISYGYARTEKSYMAAAAAPASQMALDKAGLKASDLNAVKHHNAFISNDIYLADTVGLDLYTMNNFGSTIVYGHPQAPVLGRLMIEGIEELAMLGGGYLLVAGGTAGDSGSAIILKIN